jgi:hypothetical protein
MFEQSMKPEVMTDAEALEGRSADEISSRRLAALVLALNAILATGVGLLAGDMPNLGVLLSVVLALYLYKLRPRAENLAIGLALLASVVVPLLHFWRSPFLLALISCLATWGVTGALLLLLVGEPRLPRRVAAIVLFVVLAGGTYGLALVSLLALKP